MISKSICALTLTFATILEIIFSLMLLYARKYSGDEEEKVIMLVAWCIFTFTYAGLILEVLSRTV